MCLRWGSTARLVSYVFLALMAVFAGTREVQAQNPTGRIAGTLTDQSGAVIQGAQIEITSQDSGFTRSAVTDETGSYAFARLPAGTYRLSASAAGFETSVRDDVKVSAGSESSVPVLLTPARQSFAVTVTRKGTSADLEAVVSERARTSDTASLIGNLSGLDSYTGGGLSNVPSIHGLADDRVNVLVNGMSIGTACTMHMNPAISYIDPPNVGGFNLLAGTTPVSRGGDSIGGTIEINSPEPEFAKPGQGVVTHGGISAFHRTNGVNNGGSVWLSAATEKFQIRYTGSYVNANDYKDGSGAIVHSTFYEAQNNALQLATRLGNHLFTVDLGYQHIPQQGFVNAFMDMTGNEGKLVNLHYEGNFSRVRINARTYFQNTRHSMNILRDKTPGFETPDNTKGTNLGYVLEAELPLTSRDTLRVGTELRRFTLNDWWSPTPDTNGPNTLLNVNHGTRARFGTYAEWETRTGRKWTELFGVRSDVVRMNTGNVVGYNSDPAATGSAAYYADAQEFNSRDHHRLDANFDLSAMARYEPNSNTTFEFGYSRKTRSPSIYERYLWVKRSFMTVNMQGWFGDGNGYTGNLDLKPEVAHTISASVGWHDRAKRGWEVKLTPYFTRVQNYIDANRCPVIADGSDGCTADNFTATSGFVTLQFANHAARLYGFDASVRAPLGGSNAWGRFSLNGVFGYVHGTNLDTGGNLYHMMPLHGDLALEHHRGNWSSALEFKAVNAKTDVDEVRVELPTAGYALLNLRSGYRWRMNERSSMRLDAGIDNLANRRYDLPLGGRYWDDMMGMTPVPGTGRSYYTGLTLEF